MTTTEPAKSLTIRRATVQDVEALLPLASKCVGESDIGGLVALNDEAARTTLLRCLASGAGTGCVFVAEAEVELPNRPHETRPQIVGALLGEMRPVWHSRTPIAEHLGGFALNPDAAEPLRAAFRQWARDSQRAPCAIIDGAVEEL